MADKPAAQARLAFDKIKQVSSSAPGQTSYLSSSAIAPSSTSSSFAASASSTFTPIHRRPSYSCTPSRPHIMDKPHASMAPPPPPMLPMQSDKPSIASLMSPPDASLDSFRHAPSAVRFVGRSSDSNGHGQQSTSIHHQQQQHQQQQQQQQQQPLPMSPPISPYSKLISATGCTLQVTLHSHIIKDPVLYPVDEHSPASPPAQPLFAPAELEHHQRIVDDHVRARSHSIFGAVAPPRREDYELALTFRSQVMKHYTADRKGWLRKERALLEADRRAGAQRYHAIMPAKPIAAKLPKQRVDRVSKSYAASRPIRTNTTNTINTTTTTNNNNNNNNSGSSNKNNVTHPNRPAGRTSPTPEPSRRVVAPNREDKDFNSIVNYCPPLNTLPERANSLKVDWKGQPIDLSSDTHAHLLHPDELLLAGNLRLDCATYLTSKRRIFERRLQCLRTGKEFRKTDAQQACKIDVNKASKLWTAFEKVGWLKASWVSQFL